MVSGDCRAQLDRVVSRAVVNRAQLRIEVCAAAQELCRGAGACRTTLRRLATTLGPALHRRVATGLVRPRGGRCCTQNFSTAPWRRASAQHRAVGASVSTVPLLTIFSKEEVPSVVLRVTWMARAGWMLEQPLFWGAVATALASRSRARDRQAALRGSVGYLIAAFIANIVIKPLVHRRRPQGADQGRITPATSSFPSGHTASNSAFVFGVAQELPLLAFPLAAAATAAHWSLFHSQKHHLSDVLAGGAIGLGVAHIMRKSWPPDTRRRTVR